LASGIGQLVTSTDGGVSWRTVGTVSTVGTASADRGNARVVFASEATGYLYGPGLAVTTDSGKSWTYPLLPVPRGSFVTSLVPIGASVWATTSCSPPGSCQGSGAVLASDDGGMSWRRLAAQPNLAGAPASLARLTAAKSYVTSETGSDQHVGDLAVTSDGGKSWQPVSDPCTFAGPIFERLAATADRLWLLCAGSPGAGSEPMAAYQSADGGAHWTLRSTSGTGTVPAVGAVPGRCCLADLAALSPTEAWIAVDELSVEATIDGGTTWHDAVPSTGGGDGATRVTFIDSRHGWALVRRGVWRTVDGVNWTHL
jgi:photosystem II stability/assembly factor-like uncharacterized protein